MTDSGTVVKLFPGRPEESDDDELTVEQTAEVLKRDYLNGVVEFMVDDIVREMEILQMSRSRMWVGPPTPLDIIGIKEAVLSALFRSVGIVHPMQKILEENLILDEKYEDDNENVQQVYHFK